MHNRLRRLSRPREDTHHTSLCYPCASNKTVAMSTLDQLWNIFLLRKNYLSNIYIFGQPLIMAIRWYQGSRVQDKQAIRYSTNTASVANIAIVLLLSVQQLSQQYINLTHVQQTPSKSTPHKCGFGHNLWTSLCLHTTPEYVLDSRSSCHQCLIHTQCNTKSPQASPFFFVAKKDGGLLPYQDYCISTSIL